MEKATAINPDLRFSSWTADDIEHEAIAAIAAKEAALLKIYELPHDRRTFENTIVAIERSDEPFADVRLTAQLLMNVHPDADIRTAAQHASALLDEAGIRMGHDRRLYDAVMAWERRGELDRLEGPDRHLADTMLRDLRRMGFGLASDQFDELMKNRSVLERLEDTFEKAINDWEDGIEVTEQQLDGTSASYRAGLKRTPSGGYWISLQYPDLHPFLRMAHGDSARRALATKNLRKGGDENLARLAEMIRLRQRNAALLGYPTHADYVTEPRMAKTGVAAATFIRGIIESLTAAARAELRDLIDIKKRTLRLKKASPIGFHELSYWSERLRQERYHFDSETVRSYLPFDRVVAGMLSLYEELFGLHFERRQDLHVWHEEAQVYAMTDISGEPIGTVILDLHPRTGKYGHAAIMPIRLSGKDPMAALVFNFPRPTDKDPALLSHSEVETLFHEFGHLVHALVSSRVPYASQNGLAVAIDFVETPSQMMEEWTWDPNVLKRISSHRDTNEPMPDALIEKIIAARHHMDANYYAAQAVMALYDLRMHGLPTHVAITPQDIARWHREMELQYLAIDLPDDAILAAGWTHLADYDAGYYGYLWSKVYALDLFTRFAKNPLDASVGTAYRTAILEPGASKPETQLIHAFLGREGSDVAFMEALGITTRH